MAAREAFLGGGCGGLRRRRSESALVSALAAREGSGRTCRWVATVGIFRGSAGALPASSCAGRPAGGGGAVLNQGGVAARAQHAGRKRRTWGEE
jgi:hypothetical protein